MKVLGIITARGGSKGIPKKNMVSLFGKPLIYWTIECAKKTKRLNKIIISTDDEEIAQFCSSCGIEVPFLRPRELAEDTTRTLPVLKHAIEFLEKKGENYDAVFVLQPTNPLRIPSDIDGSIELLEKSNADSIMGVSPVGNWHPARMKMLNKEGQILDPPFAESIEGIPRQFLPEYYIKNGAVYLTKVKVILEMDSIKGKDCRAWIIPKERAVNIDDKFDLFLCEILLKKILEEKLYEK